MGRRSCQLEAMAQKPLHNPEKREAVRVRNILEGKQRVDQQVVGSKAGPGGRGPGTGGALGTDGVCGAKTEVWLPQSPVSEQRQGGRSGARPQERVRTTGRGRHQSCQAAGKGPGRASKRLQHQTSRRYAAPSQLRGDSGPGPGPRPGFPPCHVVAAQHPSHEALKPCPHFTGAETEAPTCNATARFQPGHPNPRPRPRDLLWSPALHPRAPLDLGLSLGRGDQVLVARVGGY